MLFLHQRLFFVYVLVYLYVIRIKQTPIRVNETHIIMNKQLTLIEFCALTISQQHSEIHHLVDPKKSERLTDATMALVEVLQEIEDEYNNKPKHGGNILEGHVLSDQKS